MLENSINAINDSFSPLAENPPSCTCIVQKGDVKNRIEGELTG